MRSIVTVSNLKYVTTQTKKVNLLNTERRYRTSATCLRNPKVLDILKSFPSGMKQLYYDLKTYQHIQDASKTKTNGWSKMKEMPRRQQEQQKRILREVQKVVVPATLAAVPILGNFFVILMALSPRFFLSDHFFSKNQVRLYVSDEYLRHLKHFKTCANEFWATMNTPSSAPKDKIVKSLKIEGYDKAGPIIENIEPLYKLFQQSKGYQVHWKHFYGMGHWKYLTNKDFIPRNRLLNIAQSTWLSSSTIWIQPSIVIRYRLMHLAHEIYRDDLILIQEKHHLQKCKLLTDDEILDACFRRCLPCGKDDDYKSMRQYLTSHLLMMEKVTKLIPSPNCNNIGDHLFILHLPALRYELSK
mmetsp:Transcript_16614/g.19248  ORF Transcript_16614/g.19248 Transcript_16614/m.19248 type:complete len:357 (-) Transcript_16614:59-1129(-)